MEGITVFCTLVSMFNLAVTLSTADTNTGSIEVIQESECRVVLNDTKEVINLEALRRTDGHPRYMTSFETQDQLWNYTFNPCVPYTIPFKNPHETFGDSCHSVSLCQFSDTSDGQFYYPLGVQDKADFTASRDGQQDLHVELRFKGVGSMRHKETIVRLVCDESRTSVHDGLFLVVKDGGKMPMEAELHHKCCCPGACLEATLDGSAKGADKSTMLILVGTVITLMFVAVAIGGLCYIKRTHLQIYYKLPGLHTSPPTRSTSGPSSIEQGYAPSSRPVAYRDYEPASSLRKKLLPVLDDAIISIDSLELGQRLGGGIFGDTHIATWHDITVAVKRLTINVHGNQVTGDTMEFMKSEVWFLSRQRHKNIVTVIGLCLDGKHPSIITEYVQGGECLKDFIKVKGKQLTWPQRIRMCNHVADGMAFLHSTKPPIIHRDLRCGNLFLMEDDNVKVADFCQVKLLQPVRQECTQDDCCCRRQYSGCPASFRWTAPELLSHPTAMEDDAVITTACDVYSFSVVMWELVMAVDPYDDLNTEPEVREAVLGGRRPELPTSSDMMPPYKELMKECWVQEPHNRPTFKQVAIRLKEISNQARSFQKVVNNRNKQQNDVVT